MYEDIIGKKEKYNDDPAGCTENGCIRPIWRVKQDRKKKRKEKYDPT